MQLVNRLLILALGGMALTLPGLAAQGKKSTQEQTLAAVTKLGGKFRIDEKVASKPVVMVDLSNTEATDDVLHQALLRRPKYKVNFDASWQATNVWLLNVNMLWVSSWVDGNRDFSQILTARGYTTVNLTTAYDLSRHLALYGRIDNLFDRHYQNPIGFLQPPLGIFGGINVKL